MFFSLRTEDVEQEAPEEVPADSRDDSQHCLWVDEFAPKHYTELLSDDVRPCACLSVTGFLVAVTGEFRVQPYSILPAHREWRTGLWSALLSGRWGN